jgi:hypothetical protein
VGSCLIWCLHSTVGSCLIHAPRDATLKNRSTKQVKTSLLSAGLNDLQIR